MNKWYLYSKKADFKAIGEKFGIDQVTARILRNRDISSDEAIEYFLYGGLGDLYDERLLPDIDKAADAVLDTIRNNGRIRIVGDYDIDGVCSTCILLKGLRAVTKSVDSRIPDRIADGYGINIKIIDEAVKDGVDLILTCDNGIAAIDELKKAAEHGIKTVVTDHHSVRKDDDGNDILPEACAVVDVKRSVSRYPTEEICGAVTAWKLIRVIYRKLGRDENEWLDFTDLAAMATIGDIMTLKGENHIIVKEGLKILNGGSNPAHPGQYGTSIPGLKELLRCLDLNDKEITAYHIGFVIGPCINAGGRLENADVALKLFMTEDAGEARILAEHLISLNESRKSMTEKGVRDGLEIINGKYDDRKVLVVYLPGLHESLAGIVAGRIKENYYKPVIIITDASSGLKGSGRSIEGYDMFEALCGAEDLLSKFGGHKMAAGLSLDADKLEALRERLNENAVLTDEDFVRKVWIDVPMPFGYITEKLINEINRLGPFGQGFDKPVFARRNIKVSGLRVLGRQKNALKMRLTDTDGITVEGVLFGDAEAEMKKISSSETISILYYPKINEYAGRRTLQLEIRDYQIP